MFFIRPIAIADLEALVGLAGKTGYGLTTLPRDPELLRNRILESQMSFARMCQRPRGETYLFVLEELGSGEIVGTSGVTSKVGGFEPFYAYRIETAIHESDVLKVRKEIQFLKLVMEHNGPCEVGSLFLSPRHRREGNGRLLSLARFLFMAEHPQRFDPVVISELRGMVDDEGHSPFWDALGRHFFEVDFPTADYLSMVNKKFIADLMPTHPIYIPLLPAEAQAAIGQVHPQTQPALRMLETEGFRYSGMVDIFDAGPSVRCDRDRIRAIRQSMRASVEQISREPVEGESFVICNVEGEFRACRGTVTVSDGRVWLAADVAEVLRVKAGDVVRLVSAQPKTKENRDADEKPAYREPMD
jgi:arginine N-succinyltransferase